MEVDWEWKERIKGLEDERIRGPLGLMIGILRSGAGSRGKKRGRGARGRR